MAKECKKCGTMNPQIESNCINCGEALDNNQNNRYQRDVVDGSSWAGILSVFLIVFGVVLFVVNFVYLITVDEYNILDFLLGLMALAFYFVFFGALIEVFDNVALTKNYMKKNHEYLKKIAEKDVE